MWAAYVLPFLSGMFAANSVPHLVYGLSGRPFRTPFVRFSGAKVSGPAVNAAWGWVNVVAAWLLAGLPATAFAVSFGLGALLMGVAAAFIFARDA